MVISLILSLSFDTILVAIRLAVDFSFDAEPGLTLSTFVLSIVFLAISFTLSVDFCAMSFVLSTDFFPISFVISIELLVTSFTLSIDLLVILVLSINFLTIPLSLSFDFLVISLPLFHFLVLVPPSFFRRCLFVSKVGWGVTIFFRLDTMLDWIPAISLSFCVLKDNILAWT
uniref:Uncharacterized protein n=1 Tax=Cacopsylla melanoneura TaxID=428564 RepID=A0A8D8T600_9HEMI